MHILGVGLEQSILKADGGQSESSLHMKICHIFGGNLRRQRSNEGRELSVGVMVLERAEELGGAVLAEKGGLIQRIEVPRWRP
jgi:hypothetical protein